MPTVIEIVHKFLKDNQDKYDGLSCSNGCYCLTENFTCPCPEPDCETVHKAPCSCGKGCTFDLVPGPKKQEKGSTNIRLKN